MPGKELRDLRRIAREPEFNMTTRRQETLATTWNNASELATGGPRIARATSPTTRCGRKPGRSWESERRDVPRVIQTDDVQLGSTDLDELRPLLRRLVGKPFLFFRASYGDELTLHLGEAVPYPNPKMKGKIKGSFIVASRASSWILEPGMPPGRLFTADDIRVAGPSSLAKELELKEIETRPTIRHRSIVTDAFAEATASGILLSLLFSDGSNLLVLPIRSCDAEGDDGDPLSDWEIFMPRHRVLKAGPTTSWSYTNSQAKPNDETSG
jgi:hypothetical protein